MQRQIQTQRQEKGVTVDIKRHTCHMLQCDEANSGLYKQSWLTHEEPSLPLKRCQAHQTPP